MLLLNRGDRTHPEDGVQAPGRPGEKKCPMELRAEQVVRTYFSLDNSRPIGLSAFCLVIIMMPPKDRARQFCFMAEMMSISTGLLLFFVLEQQLFHFFCFTLSPQLESLLLPSIPSSFVDVWKLGKGVILEKCRMSLFLSRTCV